MSTIKVTNLKHESSSSDNISLDSSGRVGIGTPNPATTLDCNGIIRVPQDTFYQSGDGTGGWVELIKADSSNNTYIKNNKNRAIIFETGGTEKARIDSAGDLKFNSGYGSAATAYGCRAWVNFNGTSTVAIRASGNVSSITDNGTGDYTVNFTTAMPDVNYSTTASVSNAPGTQNLVSVIYTDNTNTPAAPTTSAFRMQVTANSGEAKTDATYVCCSIFR